FVHRQKESAVLRPHHRGLRTVSEFWNAGCNEVYQLCDVKHQCRLRHADRSVFAAAAPAHLLTYFSVHVLRPGCVLEEMRTGEKCAALRALCLLLSSDSSGSHRALSPPGRPALCGAYV